tara:strand:+ start:7354 stop:11739 length:4386 start_codon:yes stop_codon:yes gene_type:complete
LAEYKKDIYTIDNLSTNIITFLDGINAPEDLPKYNRFVKNLILVIDTLLDLVLPEKKTFLLILKQDLQVQLERNISDIHHAKVNELSPTYYLLIQFNPSELSQLLKLSVSVFVHAMIGLNNQGQPTFQHHLSDSLQDITRRFITSINIIPGIRKTIFDIFQEQNIKLGNDASEVERLNKLKIIFERIGGKIDKDVDNSKFKACTCMVSFTIRVLEADKNIDLVEKKSRALISINVNNKKVNTYRKKGLPPEVEYQEPINIDVYESTSSELSFKSQAELKHWARTRAAMLNNYPQEHSSVLNDLEARALYDFLLRRYTTQKEIDKKTSFSVLLMLIIGLDVTWLKYVKIVKNLPDKASKGTIYITTAGVIFYTVPKPQEKKENSQKMDIVNQFHSSTLKLAMPTSMLPIIQSQNNVAEIENKLDLDNDRINKLFDAIRHKLGRHFTRYTVKDYAFNLFYRSTNDEVLATFLCPITNYTMPTGCYYTSITSNALSDIHSKSLSISFGEVTKITTHPEEFVGSDILVSESEIIELLEKLKAKLSQYNAKSLRTLKQLIQHHNYYSKYISTIMLLLTGHRPVNDIFDDKNYLFIQNKFCFIGDKASSFNNVLRLCPLANVLVEQLELYEQHLLNLAFRLQKLNPILAEDIYKANISGVSHTTPFLFIVNNNNKLEGINENILKEFWGDDFCYPANFYRHFLSSKLASIGIPRERINYLLGHISTGQNPLSRSSTLNTINWLEEIGQYVGMVGKELNIEAIKGIEKGKNQTAIETINLSEQKYLFGTALRQENRMMIMKKVVNSVNHYFQKELPRVLNKDAKTYTQLTDIEIENLKSYIDKLPAYQIAKSYTTSQKILNRYAKKFNRKSDRIWYVYTHDESVGLSLESPLMLQHHIYILEQLQEKILKILTADTHSNFSYLMSACYLYALATGLSYKTDLKNFIKSVQAPLIKKNGSIFVAIKANNNLVNWAPNNISLILINLVRAKWPKVYPAEKNINHNIEKLLRTISLNTGEETTFQYFLKVNKLGYILNASPCEYAQSNGEVLFIQDENISDKATKNTITPPSTVSDKVQLTKANVDIPIYNNFLSKLRLLSNQLSDMEHVEKKDKLKAALKEGEKEHCNLTQLISFWGSYMLANGTRKTLTPAVSTIISYMLSNSKLLSEFLRSTPLLSLDDVEISTLFEMIIELNNSSKNSVSALLSFNDFLAETFQRKDIYLGDIAWRNSGIDKRTFSNEEVVKLLNDEIFTPNELFFIQILAEVGCRESEAYTLLPSDFDLIAQSIQFRKNKLGSLKTPSSRRPFTFKRLSDGLIEKIYAASILGTNSTIFNVNVENEKQSSYKDFCLKLNSKIRKVLNNHLSLKHFRHFRARELFMDRNKSSLRDLWQVSALIGHSSPKTTQRNYIQNILQKNDKAPISDDDLSKIFNIKLATIRQHRKRYFQNESVALANAHLSIKYIIKNEDLNR